MADSARARRLAKRIVAIVATELGHEVKDPRLAMITITAATVTPDLRDAVVYYTVYGNELDVDSTAAALASATGVLRSAVGRQTGIKFTPTLSFVLDKVPDTARQMDELLNAAKAADAAVAAQAAAATYAGDADPYKTPREIASEESDDDVDSDSDDDVDSDVDGVEGDESDDDESNTGSDTSAAVRVND